MKKTLIAAFIILFSVNAHAFVTGVDFFGIDFRINNPGARANGMGGAFIGLADDATAAYTNPAGLTVLTQPEISAEYKYGNYTTLVIDEYGKNEYEDSVNDVSFLSFVYPKDKATVSVFRHKFIDIESNYFWHESRDTSEYINRIDLNIDSTTLGAGLGLKLTDSFSIGVAVGFDMLNYKMFNETIKNDTSDVNDYKEQVNDNDTATHYTVSCLWNPVGEFNIGMAYRQGPEYTTRKIRLEKTTDNTFEYIFDYGNTIKVPDVYGIGLSYRFLSSFTVAFDVNYIEYSDLLEGLLTPPDDGGTPQPEELDIDDEVEIHAGLEYILDINNTPVALRCGYFFKPSHRLQYTGSDENTQRVLPKGDDDHIFSIGFGFVPSDNIQIDIAGLTGDFEDEFTMSVVYRYN